ncbi:MAG: hypothetical protein ACI4SM_03195 [Candidatus Gastranaerophilaceae bacterium]
MKTIREKIEIMQAYEMGEQIQIKNSKNVWEDIDCPLFDWVNCNYRVKPKQTEYPNTYKECCEVIDVRYDISGEIKGMSINECNLYPSFIAIIRCRDAYWKIAGEQMGLDKPWDPELEDRKDKFYCIYRDGGEIVLNDWYVDKKLLAFPTIEMRNAFYENFKDLIEKCKKLL